MDGSGHTFDENTLIILYELGFKYITDGIGLFPFKKKNMLFIPQQFWCPTKIPFGVGTVCIHSNNENAQLFQSIKDFIRAERKNVISFYEATDTTCTFMKEVMNKLLRNTISCTESSHVNRAERQFSVDSTTENHVNREDGA